MRSKNMSSYGSWLLLLSSIFALGAAGSPAPELDVGPKLEKKADGSTKAGICNYLGFQSIFMQDRVYVDGGQLNYIVNGTAGTQQTTVPEYPTNLSYIDLNKPFDFSKQLPEEKLNFFTPVDSAQGRPAILFGGLLGDDYSWLQYGGMRGGAPTDGSGRSEGQSERFDFKQDPENPTTAWAGDTRFGAPLTLPKDKDDTVTNWVYAGAVARSPGDKKSWWFSGSRGKNWGEVIFLRRTENQSVGGLSNYLITADFSFQQVPKLTNTSIDSSVAPRAGASMVFLPVGEKGILAVLGGVSVPDPVWMVGFGARDKYSVDDLKNQATASRKFLQTINIYDIASGNWYSQNTTGQIPAQPISAACAVAASADDRSSHNIYFYGGHGGLSYTEGDPGSETNNKFYVLTLPNFRWIEVLDPASGEATGRSLHQCHRVQPDQMLIIGGHPTANSPINKGNTNCALWPGPGPAMVFDLNTCQVHTDGWDPRKKADYRVPDKVVAVIGGSGTGGASKTAPENGWSDDGLKKLFSNPKAYTARDTPIWAYTPTDTNTAPGSTDTNSSSSSDSGGSSFPSYIPPLLGTLLGLFALITILSIILFVLRRRKQRRAADAAPSETEGSTVRKNKQTWSWLLGVYGDEKSSRGAHQPLGHMRDYSDDFSHGTGMYGASSGLGSEANRESVMSPISPITEGPDPVMELQGKVIHEMPDTSVPQELAGGYYPKEKNDSRPKEGKSVRYDDQQQKAAPEDEIQTQGTSHSLGHRKMSSLDYPE